MEHTGSDEQHLDEVRAAQGGDQTAFERLMLRYRELIYGVTNRIVDDYYAAEDISQEVFLTAYLKLDTLQNPRAFGPWLKQITVNKCFRYVEKLRKEASRNREAALMDPYLDDEPQQETGQTAWISRMEAAVEELSGPQCELLDLFYVKCLSHAEIADFMGIPTGTVKRRLFDVRKKLQKNTPASPTGKEASQRFVDAFRAALDKKLMVSDETPSDN